MTLPHIPDPMPGDAAAADAIATVIVPPARDLGGFEVRRAPMQSGQGIDVRPHPHIGLATVTWLFDGSIHHRDSQAFEAGRLLVFRPGDAITIRTRSTARLMLLGGEPGDDKEFIPLADN